MTHLVKRWPAAVPVPIPALGWSGGAMVLGRLPVSGRPINLIIVGQEPTALTVGAGGDCLDIFTLVYHFSFLSPSLWETAQYRLKYCHKGPLSLQQPTNQPIPAGGGNLFNNKLCSIVHYVLLSLALRPDMTLIVEKDV